MRGSCPARPCGLHGRACRRATRGLHSGGPGCKGSASRKVRASATGRISTSSAHGTVQRLRTTELGASAYLDVGLVHHIQPQLVAQLVPSWAIGIVAAAYSVEIVGLHQADILPHGGLCYCLSRTFIMLVSVDALEHHGHIVDQQLPALYAHPACTQLCALPFHFVPARGNARSFRERGSSEDPPGLPGHCAPVRCIDQAEDERTAADLEGRCARLCTHGDRFGARQPRHAACKLVVHGGHDRVVAATSLPTGADCSVQTSQPCASRREARSTSGGASSGAVTDNRTCARTRKAAALQPGCSASSSSVIAASKSARWAAGLRSVNDNTDPIRHQSRSAWGRASRFGHHADRFESRGSYRATRVDVHQTATNGPGPPSTSHRTSASPAVAAGCLPRAGWP
eukprot:3820414-Prymnesium_polylepis.2